MIGRQGPTRSHGRGARWLAITTALAALWCGVAASGTGCSDGEPLNPLGQDAGADGAIEGGSGGGGAMEDQSPVAVPVSASIRLVNFCSSAVDIYVTGQDTPLASGVKAGQVTSYLPATLDQDTGTLEIRRAGDPLAKSPLSISDPLKPVSGDHATVALKGNDCSALPLWEHFGDTPPGTFRVRFVDLIGSLTAGAPVRLFMEQADGGVDQVVAVPSLGNSSPDGVLLPTVAKERASVRLQVDTELSSGVGLRGYQVPGSVFKDGATLFVFSLFGSFRSLFVVGSDGPPPEIPVVPGDPPGLVRINPKLTILNAVADLCTSAKSHLTVSDAPGHQLVQLDLGFGSPPASRYLPPTTLGHTIALGPGNTCSDVGAGEIVTGPLEAGGNYFQIVFGAASGGMLLGKTLPNKPPVGSGGRTIAFFNAAAGAPPLDVELQTLADTKPATVFSAVPFGGLSPSVPSPGQDYRLDFVARPDVSATGYANRSTLFVTLGDWDPAGKVPLRWKSMDITGP